MDQNNIEKELLNNPSRLSYMNNLLKSHQFTEEFLIKTRIYYDSWKCIRTQNNLSPIKSKNMNIFTFYSLEKDK